MPSTIVKIDPKLYKRLQKATGKSEIDDIVDYLISEFLEEQEEIEEALKRTDEKNLTPEELRAKLGL
jgi:hypothetical protein